ncbi:hypothetical protein OCU04_005819 [Sclerotinia nivalis]|uniref:Uncharacterized protein n=1 Tax=Sclerotinia nivalis TaxID=352851 RepID=A0A9X0ALQ5_9HELO|nr:hypothetical protein OCU04_005819 [Sclerotinia nivalis]
MGVGRLTAVEHRIWVLNEPVGDHAMGFKDCINLVLSSLILIVLWPQWVLKYSPMKRHTEVYKAFKETIQYLTELLEHKKKQMEAGEHDKVTMDLMGIYYFHLLNLICTNIPRKHAQNINRITHLLQIRLKTMMHPSQKPK